MRQPSSLDAGERMEKKIHRTSAEQILGVPPQLSGAGTTEYKVSRRVFQQPVHLFEEHGDVLDLVDDHGLGAL